MTSRQITPADLYRPSNGTEGEIFEAEFCEHCERDRAYRNDPERYQGCEILARALAYDVDDARYPEEWVRIVTIADDGLPINAGTCTAFVPIREADASSVAGRDDRTPDMFAGDILAQRRPLGPKILRALGISRKTVYERTKGEI